MSAFVAPQSTWFGNGRRGHGFVWGFWRDMRSTNIALPTDAEAGVGGGIRRLGGYEA